MYLDLAEIKWKIERYRHEKGSAHGRIGLWCVTVCGKQSSADRIKYTTAGKAGFITAFYIVIVPGDGNFSS